MHNETSHTGGQAGEAMSRIITDAANRYGVDPDTLLRTARMESNLNPKIQNPTSSAGGLFQFIDSTWRSYGQGKNKFDAYASADAGARFMRDNVQGLTRALGRAPTAGETYMAHQQGLGGAITILKDPNANAVARLGRQQVALNLPSSRKGETDTITAGQFAQLWADKIGGAGAGPLYSGGATSNSMSTTSDYKVGDANNAQVAPVVYGEVDTNRFISDAQQQQKDREVAEKAEKDSPGFFEVPA